MEAVEGAFGGDTDHVHKTYGTDPAWPHGRYSPPICTDVKKHSVEGNPDPANVTTSYAERQTLTMRMSMRHFTRLTNAFSKKVEYHAHTVALHFVHYNDCSLHDTLKVTLAIAAGVTNRLRRTEEVAALVEAGAPKLGKRGP